MSENSIEFSLLNSEQRGSWLNSGHWTLDADRQGFWSNRKGRSRSSLTMDKGSG